MQDVAMPLKRQLRKLEARVEGVVKLEKEHFHKIRSDYVNSFGGQLPLTAGAAEATRCSKQPYGRYCLRSANEQRGTAPTARFAIRSLHRLLACALEDDRGCPATGGGRVGNSQFIARNSVAARLRGSHEIRERRPPDLHRE
jgi:hypothetical protein